MDTVTAIHTRRSIRDYEKRAVERETIADRLGDIHWHRQRVDALRSLSSRPVRYQGISA
jgi:hypothetical protein